MISINNNSLRLAAMAGLLILGLVPQAFAAGTAAGTSVENTATVDYQVGGVPQTPVDSNTATFTVDRVVDMTLTADDSPVSTVPGASGQVTGYTLTNTSNAPLDFDFSALNLSGTDMGALGVDNQDGTSISVFLDVDGNGVYDPGTDTAASADDLAADASAKVFVVIDVPADAVDGDIIGVALTSAAKETDGSALAETAGANTAGEDTVFGDAAGATDAARDATISAYGAYGVASASITVAKSSTVISDPFNGTTDPKFIPGAVLEYCMVVTNGGSTQATDVALTDNIPANTTYVASSVATGTGASCGVSADGSPLGSESSGTVTVPFGSVAAGSSVWASFRVTLQ
ncbi:hypothetical protein [Microbulbifer sp.]|uniref:hypothetical protein n=1 Tax=Microbulbifer sp. TaxID=1908541 RepID=UPI003F3EB293